VNSAHLPILSNNMSLYAITLREKCILNLTFVLVIDPKNNVTNRTEFEAKYEKFQEALSVPAFDIDFAIPNLITVEFD
jgi:hypothetical protein